MSGLSVDTKKEGIEKIELPSLEEVGRKIGELASDALEALSRFVVMPQAPGTIKAAATNATLGNIHKDRAEIIENAKKLEIFGGVEKIQPAESGPAGRNEYEDFAAAAAASAAVGAAAGAVDPVIREIVEQAKKHPAFNREKPAQE